MGKPTGFMEFARKNGKTVPPAERINNYEEFHLQLPTKEQKKQGARCMDCGTPFCQSGIMIGGMVTGCPLNNLIPEWNDLIYYENWQQAYNRLHKTNNFPEFTGRVCPAPCEAACTCNLIGAPVSVRENEKSLMEKAYEMGFAGPKPPMVRTGMRVAVIGSGPAGLAAADTLNRRGHSVTVFERSDRVGGLLRYGIPNMKLEKSIIDRKIKVMEEEGITFICNANIGGNYKAEDILAEYDSVLLACGASQARDVAVPGREAKGIYFAVDFLTQTTKSLLDSGLKDGKYVSAKDKNVLVIGGGDTGTDCIATAVRHGCKSVRQLVKYPKAPVKRAANNPWPEWPKVFITDYGQEDAIALQGFDPRMYCQTVKEFKMDEQGNLKAAVLIDLAGKENPNGGKMIMSPVEGSEHEIEVDLVLIAAGFAGSESYVTEAFGVEVDQRTNVKTEKGHYKTNIDKVFTAGDMHRGQSLVVWAIREGREAAHEVDESLMGYSGING